MKKFRRLQTGHTRIENRSTDVSSAARLRRRIRRLAEGAIIAALYVALTWVANALGLASMAIQVRFSEAMCVLTFFTPAAIPGLWVGCLLANLTTGAVLWDIVFGSLATLLGARGAWGLGLYARRLTRGGHTKGALAVKILIPLPTVLANTLIIPLVLLYAYSLEGGWLFFALTVGAGEVISAWILGLLLLFSLEQKSGLFGL